MEVLKQIIYRDSDGVIMLLAENAEFIPKRVFSSELSVDDKAIFYNMRAFALTEASPLLYIVYTREDNILDLESPNAIPRFDVDQLGADKLTVDAFISMCETLLNS
jgi:hypothetical protein